MASILSRLKRVCEQVERGANSKITVYFEDGHTERMDGGQCVDLINDNVKGVLRFEANGPGHGLLPDLLNGLLTCE